MAGDLTLFCDSYCAPQVALPARPSFVGAAVQQQQRAASIAAPRRAAPVRAQAAAEEKQLDPLERCGRGGGGGSGMEVCWQASGRVGAEGGSSRRPTDRRPPRRAAPASRPTYGGASMAGAAARGGRRSTPPASRPAPTCAPPPSRQRGGQGGWPQAGAHAGDRELHRRVVRAQHRVQPPEQGARGGTTGGGRWSGPAGPGRAGLDCPPC